MNTTSKGKLAEQLVVERLIENGLHIVSTNWRTRMCEIDIVAQKNNIIYFCEVKFRSSVAQGEGLEYITPAKLKQIKFAATVWCSQNNWNGDYRILGAAVGVVNNRLTLLNLIEID